VKGCSRRVAIPCAERASILGALVACVRSAQCARTLGLPRRHLPSLLDQPALRANAEGPAYWREPKSFSSIIAGWARVVALERASRACQGHLAQHEKKIPTLLSQQERCNKGRCGSGSSVHHSLLPPRWLERRAQGSPEKVFCTGLTSLSVQKQIDFRQL